MIFFDHNATTPIDPRVVEAMMPYLINGYGNPSSLYRLGRLSRSAIDSAREQVAALVDVLPSQIIFTSGGTEANALAMESFHGRRLFLSAIEHPAVAENVLYRQTQYTRLEILPISANGVLSTECIENLALCIGDVVCLMLANNETGALQPVAELSAKASMVGAWVHTDAVQALGKIPVSFNKLGVQSMSLSSHKIYGPKGCGALVITPEISIHPLLYGGDQEQSMRAGTENVAAIVGFGKAAELARLEFQARADHLLNLRAYLEKGLSQVTGLVIFAEQTARLPNTVQFAIPDTQGEMLLMQLDKKGIAVSSGSACKAGSLEPSPVLTAMGIQPKLAQSAIRISLGKDNSFQQVDQFLSVLQSLV
ncbi:MAG: hypothetical protein RL563_1769 [Pseudomonadota bacterium]